MKKLVFLYILGEIIPTFLIGIAVFLFIISMTQFLQLSEFLLVHNIGIGQLSLLMFDMMVSFLPMILPTSLLFAVLLTYARLSADSEVVAFTSLGYSPLSLSLPAVFFSVVIGLISAQTLFVVGPVARFNFDATVQDIGNQKIMSAVQAGTFSENFFDLTLYTNEIDREKNTLKDIFIYDKRNTKDPRIIIAKQGRVETGKALEHQSAKIILTEGNMFSSSASDMSASQVKFESYSLTLAEPKGNHSNERDTNTYTLKELREELKKSDLDEKIRKEFEAEMQRRLATAAACLIFGFLGAGLGSSVNRRSTASSGFVLCVICIALYWLCYAAVLASLHKTPLPPKILLWVPNTLFALATAWIWHKKNKPA